nr:IS1595 family transposase [Saprospiraceae bacterium]
MIPEDFKSYFTALEDESKKRLIDELLELSESSSDFAKGEERSPVSCPQCKSVDNRPNGYLKGVRRYCCTACGKYYSETTNKFWYNIKKKSELKNYMYHMLQGHSIRRCASECNISIQTSFNWRHKILSSFEHLQPSQYSGIVESDEMYLRESHKGNRKMDRASRKRGGGAQKGISKDQIGIIATCDRKGNKGLKVVGRGRMTKSEIKELLSERIAKDGVLCTDEYPSYKAFAKEEGIVHKTHKSSLGQRVTEQIYHVQNVNNLHQRSKQFLEKFNGVSTKYLQNYLNWFLALEKVKNSRQRIQELGLILFTAAHPIENYIQIINGKYLY